MYTYGFGGLSSIVHIVAGYPKWAIPVLAAGIAVVAINHQPTPPPPPAAIVMVAAEPTPSKAQSYTCEFSTSAAPTNLCKASLDSVALFLGNDSAAKVKLTGSMSHVLAVRKYFTQGESKLGITSDRIEIDAESGDSDTVTVEQIP